MRIISLCLVSLSLQFVRPATCSATSPADAAITTPTTTVTTSPIQTGADQMNLYLHLLRGKNVAIFANATSVIGNTHLVDTLLKRGIRVVKIFSPEHGFRGEADAGAKVGNQQDPSTGIPIISLYGTKNKPSPSDLEGVDILVFDIQDVGVRFYTYISSMQKYLEAAIENHRTLIILDRPNPNGFYVDGPILDTKYRSFVGMQPIPVVYGMTIGEYAKMLLGEKWLSPSDSITVATAKTAAATAPTTTAATNNPTTTIPATTPGSSTTYTSSIKNTATGDFRLIVIPCRNYTHKSRYTLPVKPSPNLPNMQSVYLYASLCLFEGTPVSLGRGTTKPFQQFGNPSFPSTGYSFTPQSLPGATSPPQLGKTCNGYDLSQGDAEKATGNRWTLKWVLEAYRLFPDKDSFFLHNGGGFDRLAGGPTLRQQIKEGLSEDAIRKTSGTRTLQL
ncbi:exo-beta-N-acetylmuramidase NamZ family protein [Puia sp. P3]|uniref:exo-beta-N-acetylmuramidase NamZ family protein n=1 Tax=Puia sp. P3 TaxID=3423952 RepID=UPI003D67F7BB